MTRMRPNAHIVTGQLTKSVLNLLVPLLKDVYYAWILGERFGRQDGIGSSMGQVNTAIIYCATHESDRSEDGPKKTEPLRNSEAAKTCCF